MKTTRPPLWLEIRDEFRRSWRQETGRDFEASDVIVLLLLLAVGLGIAAVFVDATHAWVALLSEGAALLVGLVGAFKIGEWLLKNDRRTHWQRVSSQLSAAIVGHVLDFARDFARLLEDHHALSAELEGLRNLGSHTRAQIVADLHALHDEVNAAIGQLSASKDFNVSTGAGLLREVEIHLAPVRDAMIVRVIAVADEPTLVEPLLDLEARQHAWALAVRYVSEFALGDEAAWDAAASTLASATAVYEAFSP